MYSGTTLRNKSGRVLGAHQKIDRVARRHVLAFLPKTVNFPSIRQILHFEGYNGPDGIKIKSPSKDEPWHYIDPTDETDTILLEMIDDHLANLTTALTDGNDTRAAFEAAWLSHAIVDGLTPAHHYLYEKKLEELRGEGKETRTNFKKKLVMPGVNPKQLLKNNWEFWGAKGIITTHLLFEWGVATTIATKGLKAARASADQRIRVEQHGPRVIFLEALEQVHHLEMYERFQVKGWTRTLAHQTTETLAPTIIRTVSLLWYYAAYKAEERLRARRI